VRGSGGTHGDRAARRGQDGARPGRPRRARRPRRHHQGGRGQARRRGDRRTLRQTSVLTYIHLYKYNIYNNKLACIFSYYIYISATLLLSHMLYKCFALQVYKCTFTNACDKFTKMLCFPSA
jgi:hypothetical protein